MYVTCSKCTVLPYNDFRTATGELAEDEEASWKFIRENGYEFSMAEFRAAQDAVYKEHGITPM